MNKCKDTKEILKMLAKVSKYVQSCEKLSIENNQIKFENQNLKNQLEEANKKIQQMSEQLKQQEEGLRLKDKIIGQKNQEIQENESVIVKNGEQIKQLEKVVNEKSADILDLNDIIDQKEIIIIQKEELIDDKIEMIKNQELKVAHLNEVIADLEQSVKFLEDKNIKLSKPNRKTSDRTYIYMKACYFNVETRCQNLESENKKLELYISDLHTTLERNNIFEDADSNLNNGFVKDPEIAVTPKLAINDNSEVPPTNCIIEDDQVLKPDDNFEFVFSDVFNPKVKKKICKTVKPSKSSFLKKAKTKKITTPNKKKVRFSKIVTIAKF